jgi:hypothetical protein
VIGAHLYNPPMDSLRAEIAALAAQLIADSGLDYQSAKRKAARDVLGDTRIGASALPDNDQVDRFLLEHLELFDSEHSARVERYRRVAIDWMRRLEAFHPYLTGAAWKGIVARHALLHLQLFTDDQKELEIRLIDERVDYSVSEFPHFAGHGDVTALHFDAGEVPMLITLYDYDDLRGALRKRSPGRDGPPTTGARADRGDAQAVAALLS